MDGSWSRCSRLALVEPNLRQQCQFRAIRDVIECAGDRKRKKPCEVKAVLI